MHDARLARCPVCGERNQFAFFARAGVLSFLTAEQVTRFVHKDEDLANKGTGAIGKAIDAQRLRLPSRAEYFLSYLCDTCGLYTVDYKRILSSKEAKAVAANLQSAASDAVGKERGQ